MEQVVQVPWPNSVVQKAGVEVHQKKLDNLEILKTKMAEHGKYVIAQCGVSVGDVGEIPPSLPRHLEEGVATGDGHGDLIDAIIGQEEVVQYVSYVRWQRKRPWSWRRRPSLHNRLTCIIWDEVRSCAW
jgi:hypothetical protein